MRLVCISFHAFLIRFVYLPRFWYTVEIAPPQHLAVEVIPEVDADAVRLCSPNFILLVQTQPPTPGLIWLTSHTR